MKRRELLKLVAGAGLGTTVADAGSLEVSPRTFAIVVKMKDRLSDERMGYISAMLSNRLMGTPGEGLPVLVISEDVSIECLEIPEKTV